MNHDEILRTHGEALALFGTRVHAVRDDQWGAPTPCTEWSVRDLVNHLTAEQLWVPRLVRDGAAITDVGSAYDGEVLGDDPARVWDRAAVAAVAAFSERGALDRPVQLSYGSQRAEAYCTQMMADAVVHTWDLSRAIGAEERLPGHLATAALREVEPYAPGLAASGLFAPATEPPADADDLTRLLCLLGRRP
ncbi:TIGR03086 family metal-binding protein [Streptomyces sp. Je 1-4]|uniref:TIGR03086 family metal-binding protein n=1 Tax=Streptomyces TaxID=1883 RepID=UPI00140F239B|nr:MULTISPECIES: TIGR03086 family metal-binding protein [unclassified Streptomyces]QIK05528.1 TIGR03086 family protein [Streptomyces sp. ID38640]UYB38752.1 TIGR03086 family metal-binding protein [Streptomyces sp. Je 1-4]UZQ34729.1 TIGR03086 family metal-binding protein [Streptomyces sp. Je 1-4] [Streptomyces sp. Je 1-4 4N24]UZQ42147.1 TIGR03086 family metal-binding protein [Streptomyces sp. Je 1-4] [Streptomyces sp. Je 1-4 4N24_ara]